MLTVKKSAMFIFFAVTVYLSLAACSSTAEIGEPPPDGVCSSIINAKCVQCHYKTRICDALGTKSLGNWKRSIKFMIKQGAQLTPDEQNKVIACLHAMPRGSNIVCE